MRRREFITLLGGAAAWPLAARAQRQPMPVIGYLSPGSPDLENDGLRAFRHGLSERGYVEGRNVAIEYRWAEGRYDRLPALASELVRRQVAVIVASTFPCALAAKAATTTIPIVFSVGGNPVDYGLVASLNRPGGNLTGVSGLNVELGPKRMELLHQLVPAASVIALVLNPFNPNAETQSNELQAATRTLGLEPHVVPASSERDLDAVFAMIAQLRAGALVLGPDPFIFSRTAQIAALALRHAVPTVASYREAAVAGCLMSYGSSFTEGPRAVGVYTGRILKGDKPADLPVQQAVKIELVINLKTAKALGLDVPPTLLALADEVIE